MKKEKLSGKIEKTGTEKKRGTSFKVWLSASRPKTLPASIVPVIMGTVMAYSSRRHHFLSAVLALICAVLIQVVTNFVNDYSDFKKGTDSPDRIGPLRVTQAGLVTPGQMLRAIASVIFIVFLLSVYLVYRGGLPIVVIGFFSVLSGILYTAGPFPLGYVGLGDLFVLIFFGPAALAGTYYVQTLQMDWTVICAGFGPGLMSVAILTVNNLRDIENDRKAGKKTLAVRFGRSFAVKEYLYSLLAAASIPTVIYFFTGRHVYASLVFLMLFFTPRVLENVFSRFDGPSLNQTLADTGKLLLLYGLLFSIGWLL